MSQSLRGPIKSRSMGLCLMQAREASLQQAQALGRSKVEELEAAEELCRRLEEVLIPQQLPWSSQKWAGLAVL